MTTRIKKDNGRSSLISMFVVLLSLIAGAYYLQKSILAPVSVSSLEASDPIYEAIAIVNSETGKQYTYGTHVSRVITENDFNRLQDRLKLADEGYDQSITVFMMLTCPHCYTFEKTLSQMVSDDIQYEDFNFEHLVHAKNRLDVDTFYRIKSVGDYYGLLHEAIHAYQKEDKNIHNYEVIGPIMDKLSINEEKQQLFMGHSDIFNKMAQDGLYKGKSINLRAVPTVVINGQYMVNRGEFESHQDVIEFTHKLWSVLKRLESVDDAK